METAGAAHGVDVDDQGKGMVTGQDVSIDPATEAHR
jgi:hypothetical protein